MKLQDLILEETEDWIAINKPSGLLSIPDREGKDISLKKILQEKYKTIYTVHRIDRDTSGLILFAKNEKSHQYLSIAFEERKTEKIYLGLTLGSFLEKRGTIDAPIGEHPVKKGVMVIHKNRKESRTDYEVLEDFGMYSWVRFQIFSGRTHQIRIHSKSMGHPVACDPLYGDGKPVLLSLLKHKKFKLSKNEEEERPLLNRLALHAFQLSFIDQDGKNILLEAAPPKDLRATLNQLQKWKKK
ncbi:MAG: RNA pseudouridine synthase [Bacteroidetes bacterium]|nr:RNA pseudouridine synthase [Bacteroidota bacterium]MBS1633690.1 RNA pseudouridine synthase [Bacteroidota bacterium]